MKSLTTTTRRKNNWTLLLKLISSNCSKTKILDLFMQQINELNHQAASMIKQKKPSQALKLLQQAEAMLEYAASCGKVVDRNLIIVILYNQACSFQWYSVLALLFLVSGSSTSVPSILTASFTTLKLQSKRTKPTPKISPALRRRRPNSSSASPSLRAHTYTSRGSQIKFQIASRHKQALSNAKKSAQIMRDQFRIANQFCKEWIKKHGSQGSATTTQSNQSNKSKKELDQAGGNRKVFYMRDEVEFAKLIVENSKDILADMMNNQMDLEALPLNEKQILREAKRQLYFWRNNPENNEKHIRKELNIPAKEDEQRSILGVQNVQEWIENFNIGTIMHMTSQTYEEFTSYGEMIYEISKRVLLEKVIYLSISQFTIATELRFIELEKAKLMGIKDKDIHTDELKLSELYHLKAIEIACKHITSQSPYINHLITSYHKHYNSNLEAIQEESCTSIASEINTKEQRLQKLKQVQMQTIKENQVILNKLTEQQAVQTQAHSQPQHQQQQVPIRPQLHVEKIEARFHNFDQSPTGRLLTSFLNQPSPLKSNRNTSDNIKPQTNLIEQMILNKRRNQIPSDMSPTNYQKTNNYTFLNDQSANVSQERIKDLSSILRKQTFNEITSNMPIQLQPYKSGAKYNLANLIKSSPLGNNQQMKQFVFENCRTERQLKMEPSYSPISTRNQNRSPEQPQKGKNLVIGQNKTPSNRIRTNTEQQQHSQQLPLKLETIQQLLKGRAAHNSLKGKK